MKSITLAGLSMMVFLIASSFKYNQYVKQPQDTIKNGFYMNGGCTKVDSITCYGYDNLYYIHEVTKEMLAYDKITYEYAVVNFEEKEHDLSEYRNVDGRIFNAKLSDKTLVKIPLNFNLEYTTNKETLNNAYFVFAIEGSMISGYEEKWNDRTSSVEKKPVYKKTMILYDKIPLTNRKFFKTSFFSGFSTKAPKIPVAEKSPNCYPCTTEKPDIFEFLPSGY